ncbi:GUN4 domain-containing protein [Microcoleus sp. A006_D1]|uniref:GUN4 domain-containing protein n=1 Tax=Microcoleus sp. A006_D1 TaxID=3055267 RepID=UPI002FD018CD
MGRNFGISIGINQYEFSQTLKYAKRDAELMRDFLVKEAGFEQVLLYSDDSPNINGKSTRASFVNLRRVLRAMFEKPFMEAGDNFWFFFSGHGMRHKGSDYLMACDSDPGDVSDTAISISYVTQQLRRCGADNVVLILDACREGEGSKSGEGIGNQAAQVAREKGVITIFSCSPNELSYEIDDLQQGIFTKALLDGLGAQGKCATVERLNHYLNGRVPDLIRQYKKGNTSRQTPYMIAEPASKYHLILCPQYATKADVAPMKFDASIAELHQDFDLAEQLWIRVLAASPGGDMDAVKGLQRIAVAKIQPAAIPYQPSSKNSATTEKSPQPAPPNPTPIEPDVPLKSERGVDYTKLRDLLATGKWKEADEETGEKMLEVAGRKDEGWLRVEDIDRFPCADLRTIDQLWVKYSNGRFGFSMQKRIYESLGGTREYNGKIWETFGDRVGWRVNKEWLYYNDLKFNTKSQEGHLPGTSHWDWLGSVGGGCECRRGMGVLFSRVETCRV